MFSETHSSCETPEHVTSRHNRHTLSECDRFCCCCCYYWKESFTLRLSCSDVSLTTSWCGAGCKHLFPRVTVSVVSSPAATERREEESVAPQLHHHRGNGFRGGAQGGQRERTGGPERENRGARESEQGREERVNRGGRRGGGRELF